MNRTLRIAIAAGTCAFAARPIAGERERRY